MSDLRRYYQFDLLDMFRPDPPMTARTLLWLVEHLPDDSATFAAMRGGREFRAWTTDTHLFAAMVNMLYAANRQRGGKATRTPIVKPPVPKKREVKRTLDLKQVRARLKSQELHRKAAQAKSD